MKMQSQRALPLTLELPMSLRAFVYPTPEGGRGVTARGSGYWTLRFEPTRNKNLAHVLIQDIAVSLDPLRIPFDIDRDGMLECLEVEGLQLSARDFDLKRSGGEYDLRTGYITLNLFFAVRPDFLPLPPKRGAAKAIPFEIKERGWLDFATGNFKTDAGSWTVPDGPLAGLSIVADQTGEIGREECYATMTLGVGIYTASLMGTPPSKAPKKIWICPGTLIVLLWESTNSGTYQVDIQPQLGTCKASGSQTIPDASNSALKAIQKNQTFTADTTGGVCVAAHDEVNVYVVSEGDEVAQTATYEPEYKFWTAQLPDHTYDKKIRVAQVIIDSGKADSITHPRWRVDHIYSSTPTGTEIPALNNWTLASKSHTLPGEYRFTPRLASGQSLPSGEQNRKVYFRLRVGCKG